MKDDYFVISARSANRKLAFRMVNGGFS